MISSFKTSPEIDQTNQNEQITYLTNEKEKSTPVVTFLFWCCHYFIGAQSERDGQTAFSGGTTLCSKSPSSGGNDGASGETFCFSGFFLHLLFSASFAVTHTNQTNALMRGNFLNLLHKTTRKVHLISLELQGHNPKKCSF